MIYLSVTTIPSRIKYFKNFYENIYSGSLTPDKIILNTYSNSLRGTELDIPKYIENLENLIIINHKIDYGPILKFLAIFENFINPNDFFIYCDDDIKYHHNWLKLLVENIKNDQDKIFGYAINSGVCLLNRLRYLKFNGSNQFIRGFGGAGLQKKYLNFSKNDVLNSLKNYNIKMSDDLIISYHINKNNLHTIPIKYSFKEYCIPFDYSKNINSISNGANNTLLPNKTRYYNICKNNNEIGKYFDLESYLFDLNKLDKNFKNEFTKFKKKLISNEYFSLVRFGDGEINYINRKKVNALDHQCNSNEIPIEFCNMLKESLCYNKDNYYIGIPCGCCEYRDKFRMNIENNFKVNNNNLTFANIFTNSNYFHFKKNIIPILKKYPIILISNKNTKLAQFIQKGYNVQKWFSVDYNAWKNYQEIIDQVLNYSKSNNIVNHLYIVCAGPVSNVLIYNLYKQENRNIYLDLGSVIDHELGLGRGTRNYNRIYGWKSLSTCYWKKPSYWYQISCDSQSKSKIMRFFLRIISLIFSLYNFIRFYFP